MLYSLSSPALTSTMCIKIAFSIIPPLSSSVTHRFSPFLSSSLSFFLSLFSFPFSRWPNLSSSLSVLLSTCASFRSPTSPLCCYLSPSLHSWKCYCIILFAWVMCQVLWIRFHIDTFGICCTIPSQRIKIEFIFRNYSYTKEVCLGFESNIFRFFLWRIKIGLMEAGHL